MTDFFLLAVAVLAAIVLARMLTRDWRPLDPDEEPDADR